MEIPYRRQRLTLIAFPLLAEVDFKYRGRRVTKIRIKGE